GLELRGAHECNRFRRGAHKAEVPASRARLRHGLSHLCHPFPGPVPKASVSVPQLRGPTVKLGAGDGTAVKRKWGVLEGRTNIRREIRLRHDENETDAMDVHQADST